MPECSCRSCLEAMLLEFRPTLLVEQIKITRVRGAEEPPRRRKTA